MTFILPDRQGVFIVLSIYFSMGKRQVLPVFYNICTTNYINIKYLQMRACKLILKYLRDELSPEEEAELESWIAESPANKEIFDALTDPENIKRGLKGIYLFEDKADMKNDKKLTAVIEADCSSHKKAGWFRRLLDWFCHWFTIKKRKH